VKSSTRASSSQTALEKPVDVRTHPRSISSSIGMKLSCGTSTWANVAHVREPRTTVVNPAYVCSRDRDEQQDSGLRRSSVERNKETDGFVRSRWGETKEQDAVGGARLTIETGADSPIGPSDRVRGWRACCAERLTPLYHLVRVRCTRLANPIEGPGGAFGAVVRHKPDRPEPTTSSRSARRWRYAARTRP
jgi:hypothetical protein